MKAIIQVFTSDLFSKVLTGSLGLLLIRFMPATEYARYTFAVAVAGVVTQTLVTSFNRIYIVGHDTSGRRLSSALFLWFQLAILGIGSLLLLPLVPFMEGLYPVVILSILASALSEFVKTSYQRELDFIRFSTTEVARTIILFVGMSLLLVLARSDVRAWQVLLLQSAAMLCVFVVAFGSKIGLEYEGHPRSYEVVGLATTILTGRYRYLFGYFFLLGLLAQVDVFMLRMLTSIQELATYGSAYRYYNIVLLALGSMHVVLLPMVQQARSVAELDQIFARQTRLLGLLVPAIVLGAWGAQWFIPWVDGGKYPGAVAVFRILACSSVLSFAFSPHVNLVMRFEDYRFLVFVAGVGLAFNVGLGFILISHFGAIGAAVTTLVVYGVLNGSVFVRARRHLKAFGLTAETSL